MSMRSLLSSISARRATISLVVPAIGTGVAFALSWSSLPDSVAIHWGPSGEADGFASPTAGAVLVGGIVLGLGIMSIVMSAVTPRSAPGGRWAPAIIDATTWALATMITLSIVTQRPGDAAPDFAASWLLAGLGAGLIGLALGLLGPSEPPPSRDTPVPPEAPRLDTPPAGTTWWVGRAPLGTPTVVVSLGLVGLGLVLGWTLSAWVAAVHIPAALAVVAMSTARVTVGSEHAIISGGLGGWPRLRVELDSVTEAGVADVSILRWGVGLRMRPGATGFITRSGEALELHRTDDTRVLVTVDDAHEAAATVNSLIERTDAAD